MTCDRHPHVMPQSILDVMSLAQQIDTHAIVIATMSTLAFVDPWMHWEQTQFWMHGWDVQKFGNQTRWDDSVHRQLELWALNMLVWSSKSGRGEPLICALMFIHSQTINNLGCCCHILMVKDTFLIKNVSQHLILSQVCTFQFVSVSMWQTTSQVSLPSCSQRQQRWCWELQNCCWLVNKLSFDEVWHSATKWHCITFMSFKQWCRWWVQMC